MPNTAADEVYAKVNVIASCFIAVLQWMADIRVLSRVEDRLCIPLIFPLIDGTSCTGEEINILRKAITATTIIFCSRSVKIRSKNIWLL